MNSFFSVIPFHVGMVENCSLQCTQKGFFSEMAVVDINKDESSGCSVGGRGTAGILLHHVNKWEKREQQQPVPSHPS